MLVYKKIKLFDAFGKKCDRCRHKPKWQMYFNNEETNFAFLCEECLRTLQAQRIPPEDMQSFLLKVKAVGMGKFEVI